MLYTKFQIKSLFSRLAAAAKDNTGEEDENIEDYENAEAEVILEEAVTAARAAQRKRKKS